LKAAFFFAPKNRRWLFEDEACVTKTAIRDGICALKSAIEGGSILAIA
jgi:hypothetical protein